MSNSQSGRSRFALVLAALLDSTGLYSRSQWATFTGVTEEELEAWLSDKSVPNENVLEMILEVLKTSHGVHQEPLESFTLLLDQPALAISPLGGRFGATLSEYLLQHQFRNLRIALQGLPLSDREDIFLQAVTSARQLQEKHSHTGAS